MIRSTRLWFCFALGFGFASVTFLPVFPAHAATSNTEQATQQLFQAVQTADLPAVQDSIAAGADVNARDRWGMTPTDIAIDRGHYRIAHFLVSVHNQRRAQPAHASDTPEANAAPASSAPALPVSAPSAPTPRETATVNASQPTASAAPPLADSPAGTPNPFDPAAPAPGAELAHPAHASAR